MSGGFDANTIYEIFRACRLCGAGDGYKMPIIPGIVGLDCPEIEICYKIKECLQIEVHQDDKMPPLICEQCAEKVHEFYEFAEKCRQINQSTRLKLGLPPIQTSQSSPEDDCILGVTEQVCPNKIEEPPVINVNPQRAVRPVKVRREEPAKLPEPMSDRERLESLKRELEELMMKEELNPSQFKTTKESRDSSCSSSRRQSDWDARESRSKKKTAKPSLKAPAADSFMSDDDDSLLVVRKRSQEKDATMTAVPKGKKLIKCIPQTPVLTSKPGPKSRKRAISPTTKKSEDNDVTVSTKRTRTNNSPLPEPKKPLAKPGPASKIAKLSQEAKKAIDNTEFAKKVDVTTKPGPASRKSTTTAVKQYPPSKKSQSGPDLEKGQESGFSQFQCRICSRELAAKQALTNHLKIHLVKFTSLDKACNACMEWFSTEQEASLHHTIIHSRKKKYRCRVCKTVFKNPDAYNFHQNVCVPYKEVPDVTCERCEKQFPTVVLMSEHRCGKPGGKCRKCGKMCANFQTLRRHENSCGVKKEAPKKPLPVPSVPEIKTPGKPKVAPSVVKRLLHAQVRIVRCDLLLPKKKKRHNVAGLRPDFATDRKCVYPYRSIVKVKKVKKEPLVRDGMVQIQQDVRDEFYIAEDYVHWDSDNSSDSDSEYSLVNPSEKTRKIPSLTRLSLKTLFSKRCLGKVPRKLRKVKSDKFDSFFNPDEDNCDSVNISGLISSLDKDEDVTVSTAIENFKNVDSLSNEVNYDSDSLLHDDKAKEVEFDFDSVKDSENFNNVNTDKGDANNIEDKNLGVNDKENSLDAKHSVISQNDEMDTDASADDAKSNQDININDNEKDKADNTSQPEIDVRNSFDEKESTNDGGSLNKNTVDEMEPEAYADDENSNNEVDSFKEKDIPSENGENIINSVAENQVESNDVEKLNGNSERNDIIDDLYDSKLMDDLDAQIGEIKDNGVNKVDSFNDLSNKGDNGMGLDNISDTEFNFDD